MLEKESPAELRSCRSCVANAAASLVPAWGSKPQTQRRGTQHTRARLFIHESSLTMWERRRLDTLSSGTYKDDS